MAEFNTYCDNCVFKNGLTCSMGHATYIKNISGNPVMVVEGFCEDKRGVLWKYLGEEEEEKHLSIENSSLDLVLNGFAASDKNLEKFLSYIEDCYLSYVKKIIIIAQPDMSQKMTKVLQNFTDKPFLVKSIYEKIQYPNRLPNIVIENLASPWMYWINNFYFDEDVIKAFINKKHGNAIFYKVENNYIVHGSILKQMGGVDEDSPKSKLERFDNDRLICYIDSNVQSQQSA